MWDFFTNSSKKISPFGPRNLQSLCWTVFFSTTVTLVFDSQWRYQTWLSVNSSRGITSFVPVIFWQVLELVLWHLQEASSCRLLQALSRFWSWRMSPCHKLQGALGRAYKLSGCLPTMQPARCNHAKNLSKEFHIGCTGIWGEARCTFSYNLRSNIIIDFLWPTSFFFNAQPGGAHSQAGMSNDANWFLWKFSHHQWQASMVSSFTHGLLFSPLWSGRRREKASVWLPFSRKRINRRWDLASWPKSFTASRSRRVAGLHKGYCIHPAASVGCQGMQMNLALQPRPKKFRTLMGDASGGRWVEALEIPKKAGLLVYGWIHRKAQLFVSGTRQ